MNEILISIKSPSWWFGVVIVSFLINLGSAYAKKAVDRALAHFSEGQRNKLEQKQRDYISILETAKRQKDGIVLLSIQQLKFLVIGLLLLILTILSLLLLTLQSNPSTLALPIVLLLLLLMLLILVSLRQASKIEEVLKLYKSSQSDN
jgi:hypothetical protein